MRTRGSVTMVQAAPAYAPHLIEAEAQTVWKARRLPPPGGVLGPSDGSVVHQFEGSFTPHDALGLVAHRAVAADVDARYLGLAGRRAVGTLRSVAMGTTETRSTIGPVLESLGVWTGGNGTVPWDSEERSRRVETLVGRLAHRGILVSRDLPLRVCPTCAAPRDPERIIYQEEEGDTYLVRFDLPWNDQVVHALVWVDAPWRLLGTSAILVHPELPYVVARYHRKDVEDLILISRSSVDRFRSWMPGATLEVIEEHPGRFFEGRSYVYPLRHEFPTGGALPAPAGTVIAVTDVTDTGTGIVLLVPGHGSTDAAIAEAKGVAGWPLISPKGQLDLTLMHKYAGLDLPTGNDFVVRDLTENGAIFAHLRVRRGVPHCVVCGSTLFWTPGRAWCLEPGRLPSDRLDVYRRLLPDAPPLGRVEVAPWPVSDTVRTSDPGAVALLECAQCERLDALDGPVSCPCGGKRYPVRRRLVLSAEGTLAAWARQDPIPVTDSVHLYVGERRRVPVVVHHLMAMSALEDSVGNVGITVLPTVTEADLAKLVDAYGSDAVRAAFVRASADEGATGTFAERCAQEHDRLGRFWSGTLDLLALCDSAMREAFTQPVGNFLGELEPEDRALLARWERTRVHAMADYDHWVPASAHRRVFRFVETDLSEYRELVRARLALKGMPTTKRSVLRTITHVLRSCSLLLGPVLPHLSEAVHRRLITGRVSIFEERIAGADRALLNDELCAAWDRWRSVVVAVRDFRRKHGLSPEVVLPTAAILLSADDRGDQFRADRPVLERLLGIGRIDVGSPREPWLGRQRQIRPVESEVQRYYPSQATQIIHLLQRMPVRKVQEAGGEAELAVVIEGLPRRIFPSMVEYSDTLPPRMVPCPWPLGELYLEIPDGVNLPDRIPPPLSSDAFWLVRRLDRRLRAAPSAPTGAPRIAVVSVSEPFATELRVASDALSRFLGLGDFRVLANAAEAPPSGRLTGRTRTGARWWVHVPGLTVLPPRSKRRPARARSQRILLSPPELRAPETDYGSEGFVAHEEAVRALGLELDELLGAPLLGPTKIARAWDHGLTSVEEYRRATFDTLADLPGFGGSIASTLVVKLGGTVPPRRLPVAQRSPRVVPSPATHPAANPVSQRPAPSQRVTAATMASPAVTEVTEREPPLPIPTSPPARPAPPPSPATAASRPGTEPVIAPEPSRPVEAPAYPESILAPEEPASREPPPSRVAEPGTLPPAPEAIHPTPDVGVHPLTGTTSGAEPPLPREVTLPQPRALASAATGPAGEVPVASEPIPESPLGEERVPEPTSEPSPAPPVPEREPFTTSGGQPAEVGGTPRTEDLSSTYPESLPEATTPPEPATARPTEAPTEGMELASPEPLPADRTVEAEEAMMATPSQEPAPEAPSSSTPERVESSHSATPSPPESAAESTATNESAEASGGASPAAPEPDRLPEPILPAALPVASPPPDVDSLIEVARAEPVPLNPPEEVPIEEGETTAIPTEVHPAVAVEPSEAVPVTPPESPLPAEEVVPEAIPPPPEPTPSGIELEVGSSILVSIQPFLDATAAGHRGVCVVRESPERISAQVGSRPVEVYWLTNLGRGKTLKPNDLPGLLTFLARSLEEDHVMAFFVEGIEYLVRIHGAEPLLARFVEFDRLAREHDARVWVHVTADLLAPADLDRIVATFGAKAGAADASPTG